jgi:hypothetical protein
MSDKLKIELDPSKIPDILKKCLDIYNEALDQKRNNNHELSYYNFVLSYNILNVVKIMPQFKKIVNKQLQELFDTTMQKISKEIQLLKQELNLYYNDHLNKLINDDVKQKIDSSIIIPLRLASLYSQNSKSILINSTDVYSKTYLIKYIKKHVQDINNVLIIHKSHKLDIINEVVDDKEYQHKQLIVIFEDIDLYEPKILDYLKKMDTENIYLICTCCSITKLPISIQKIFTEKINLGLPSLSDIINFMRYKIFNYLEYTDMFQSQYNIPLLENRNLDNIAHKLHSTKKTYMDIDKIMNKLFEINCQSSIKQNVFIPIQLDNNRHYSLLSIGSMKQNNGQSINNDLSLSLTKETNKYLYKIPKYKQLIINEEHYTNINYLNANSHVNSNITKLSFEDAIIKELFIKDNTINKDKNDKNDKNNKNNKNNKNDKHNEDDEDDEDKSETNTNTIDVVAMFEIEVSSEELNSKFDGSYQLSFILLKIFIYYLSHITLNKDKINKHVVQEHIDELKNSDVHSKEYRYYKNINNFIELIENKHSIINIIDINDLNNLKVNELKIIFHVFNGLIFGNKDEGTIFTKIFSECFSSKCISHFINLEELETKMYIKYEDKIEHLFLSKNIDIANEIRTIINNMTEVDVSIEIVKNIDGYLLNISTYDDFDLTQLGIYINSTEIKGNNSIIISNEIFNLDDDYCITNDRDIQLLVEKYPQDYAELYAEDEETWKFVKPKQQEHLDYLNKKYSFRNKFYLYLLNFVLLYQKNNESFLSQEQINHLDNLILNLQMQIDCMLKITAEFDDEEDEEDEGEDENGENNNSDGTSVDIYWKSFWNTSYAEKEDELNNIDEYNYQKTMTQLHQKFCIDINFLKKIMTTFSTKHTETKNMYNYYEVYKNKINNTKNIQEIFVKSTINIDENQHNVYSDFELTNYEALGKNDKLIQNILNKLMFRHSLYFDIFNNLNFVGAKHNNKIKWYKLQSNTTLNDIYKIGENIIKKENYMSLFKLNNTVNSPIMIKWITSYIIGCITHFNKKYKYVNMLLACLLYGGYVTNNRHMNIFEIINTEMYPKNIVNKINYIYSINNISLRHNSKEILKEIDLEAGTYNGTEFIYTSNEDVEENNRLLRAYGINSDNIHLHTKSINLKTEYLEDALHF